MTSISATAATAAMPPVPTCSGRISGIDPRDAVVRFDIGVKGESQARILPTNVVCVYAPRFAEVRVSTGTNQNVDIQTTKTDKTIAKLAQADSSVESRRLVQNQAAELARARARATGRTRDSSMAERRLERRAPSAYAADTLAVHERPEADRRAGPQPAESSARCRNGFAWTASSRPRGR